MDNETEEIVSSETAVEYWPQSVIRFLEERIEWINVDGTSDDVGPIQSTANIHNEPQRILCVY